MKNYLKSFLYLLIIIGGLFSCNKKNQPSSENNKLSKSEIIELSSRVGNIHNEGLNHIYNLLLTSAMQNPSYNYLKSETINFIESNNNYIGHDQEIQGIIHGTLPTQLDSLNSLMDAEFFINLDNKDISLTDFSNDQLLNTYLLQLEYVMESNDDNLLNNITQIIQIEQNAIEFIDDNETLFKILSICSVAKNSLSYWNANIDDWYLLTNRSIPKENYDLSRSVWPDWKKIAQADVVSAIIATAGNLIYGQGKALIAAGAWSGLALILAAETIMGSAGSFVLNYW